MVKIADFGLARETRSAPPFTDYVSTRWWVIIVKPNWNWKRFFKRSTIFKTSSNTILS
jgi:hypothetical protein